MRLGRAVCRRTWRGRKCVARGHRAPMAQMRGVLARVPRARKHRWRKRALMRARTGRRQRRVPRQSR
eukprot:4617581-Alexandrium_andersonii.AAC.1